MTPQEKAKELVDKFTVIGLQQRNEGIQCALICVDEIMEELECNADDFGLDIPSGVYSYWINIKKEIEKL